jgi:hypothetical protein
MAKKKQRTDVEAPREYIDSIVIKDLKFHYEQLMDGMTVPFVSYTEEVEMKYRRKMVKAFARVLKYYGADV